MMNITAMHLLALGYIKYIYISQISFVIKVVAALS